MSRGINKVILIGNLGRDMELTYTQGGLAIGRLSLATTEGRKKEDGTWEDVTEWHRVKVFGKTAETLSQYATKGSQLFIEGRIHYDSYEKEGVKHYTTDIIANMVRLLGKRDDASKGTGGDSSYPPQQQYDRQAQPPGPEPELEDDLPF